MASHRIESVRSDLDEWIQREYTASELPQEQFSEMYYGASKAKDTDRKDTDRIAMVSEVVQLLKLNYPDCGPLRLTLKTLSSVRHTIERQDQARDARERLVPVLHP